MTIILVNRFNEMYEEIQPSSKKERAMEEHALVILQLSEQPIFFTAWRLEIHFLLFHQINGMTMRNINKGETE